MISGRTFTLRGLREEKAAAAAAAALCRRTPGRGGPLATQLWPNKASLTEGRAGQSHSSHLVAALVWFPGSAKGTDPLLPSQASVHDRTRDIFDLDIPFLASLGSSKEDKKETGHFSLEGFSPYLPSQILSFLFIIPCVNCGQIQTGK